MKMPHIPKLQTPVVWMKVAINPSPLKSPNHYHTIVCIRVQWNHSDLLGCTPRVGRWAVGRKYGRGGALFRAEEPEDRHWTVTVVEPLDNQQPAIGSRVHNELPDLPN